MVPIYTGFIVIIALREFHDELIVRKTNSFTLCTHRCGNTRYLDIKKWNWRHSFPEQPLVRIIKLQTLCRFKSVEFVAFACNFSTRLRATSRVISTDFYRSSRPWTAFVFDKSRRWHTFSNSRYPKQPFHTRTCIDNILNNLICPEADPVQHNNTRVFYYVLGRFGNRRRTRRRRPSTARPVFAIVRFVPYFPARVIRTDVRCAGTPRVIDVHAIGGKTLVLSRQLPLLSRYRGRDR